MVTVRIGVLALQGAFREHMEVLSRMGVEAREVRLPGDLEGLDGLIIPGGESTTIGRLMETFGLVAPLKGLAEEGLPMFGTCAGLIILARVVVGYDAQPILGVMDIAVRRNALGRQVDSFEADLSIPALGEPPFPGVFIRAPVIAEVGPAVEVLARLPEGTPCAAREGARLVCAFHPELTADGRFHAYFLRMVAQQS